MTFPIHVALGRWTAHANVTCLPLTGIQQLGAALITRHPCRVFPGED